MKHGKMVKKKSRLKEIFKPDTFRRCNAANDGHKPVKMQSEAKRWLQPPTKAIRSHHQSNKKDEVIISQPRTGEKYGNQI